MHVILQASLCPYQPGIPLAIDRQVPTMSDHPKMDEASLTALKIAFTYMPKAVDVTRYEYGDSYAQVLAHIETVREALLLNDVDPEEVYGEVHPDSTPNSSY